jgi:hypothetical protein
MEPRKKGWFNFYNPQIIPDQNGDGVEDILVSNGGDILVAPYDPKRPRGTCLLLMEAMENYWPWPKCRMERKPTCLWYS